MFQKMDARVHLKQHIKFHTHIPFLRSQLNAEDDRLLGVMNGIEDNVKTSEDRITSMTSEMEGIDQVTRENKIVV